MTIFVFSDCRDIAKTEIELSLVKESDGRIDLTDIVFVPVENFSVLHCAFSMRLIAEIAPENSIFYAVVNPCVGEFERISGVTKKKSLRFVGRNTGAFGWLCNDFGVKESYEYKDIPFTPFGGKRIYPDIISSMISGKCEGFAAKKSEFNGEIRHVEMDHGTVVHVDNFGLVKIYTDTKLDLVEGDSYTISNNRTGHSVKMTHKQRMMSGQDGDLHIYYGSSLDDYIEIGAVRSDIRKVFDVKVGDVLNIKHG